MQYLCLPITMPAMAPADKPFPPPLTTAKKNIQIRN